MMKCRDVYDPDPRGPISIYFVTRQRYDAIVTAVTWCDVIVELSREPQLGQDHSTHVNICRKTIVRWVCWNVRRVQQYLLDASLDIVTSQIKRWEDIEVMPICTITSALALTVCFLWISSCRSKCCSCPQAFNSLLDLSENYLLSAFSYCEKVQLRCRQRSISG